MSAIKFSEKQIQDHIWKYRDEFGSIVGEFAAPPLYQFEQDQKSIAELTAYKILYNIIIKRMGDIDEEVRSLYLFGNEVPLGGPNEVKIRADFLGKSEGSPGIHIIELKKDGQTERQAFTELLAYANQINSRFPSHCLDDNIFVLITPLAGKTIKDAFLQSLVFDKRKIYILQPDFKDENDINSLVLKPFIPAIADVVTFSNAAFKKGNFDVLVYCWDYDETFWNPMPEGQNEENMNRVSALAAQLMEAKNIHGFVYAQQSWPELRNVLPLANKLVLVGLNPYKIALDNYMMANYPDIPADELPDLYNLDDEVNLSHILPGLSKHADIHKDWNYFTDLGQNWNSHLFHIGKEAVTSAVVNKMDEKIHSEGVYGGSFAQYELNAIENVYVFNYDFRPTGTIRELYLETTRVDYIHWAKYQTHPYYGDSYGWAIENISSYLLFETFLRRMFHGQDEEDSEDDE